jgi:uncharacterized protein with HEPN domain
MQPDERDSGYLWDMLDAARTVQQFAAGVDRTAYLGNRMMQLAVERSVQAIGEAARRVSEDFKVAHPEVPWRQIIAQRNVLAHEYGAINQDRMWAMVSNDIPDLVERLKNMVPSAPSK